MAPSALSERIRRPRRPAFAAEQIRRPPSDSIPLDDSRTSARLFDSVEMDRQTTDTHLRRSLQAHKEGNHLPSAPIITTSACSPLQEPQFNLIVSHPLSRCGGSKIV